MKIEFYKHSLSQEDIDEVAGVLKSIFLTSGNKCQTFESKFSAYTGLANTITLSSCTAALHLALLASGVGKGDEVITTPMTFIATITSILHTGATPVLVDIDNNSGLISPQEIENAITEKTKAIMPVHLFGTMADMRTINSIAQQSKLTIIEDAAHCIEGMRDDFSPGQLSSAACYSFYATKNLTCGEGGALSTNNRRLAEKIKVLRLHGMNKEAADRYKGLYKHWDMVELGWKYNLSDIQAALLVKQVDRLNELWQKRKDLYNLYRAAIDAVDHVRTPEIYGKSAHHLFTILVPPRIRDQLLSYLGQNDIGAAVNYRSVTELSWFKNNSNQFTITGSENSEIFGSSIISLPFYPGLKSIEIEYIAECLKKGIKKLM